ncbi:MAG: ankyrin repeat domain-containing protein [Sulfurimonas sp.]|nr:ankyrin repeat domain-containing protein [Sulfurimonas sp.]
MEEKNNFTAYKSSTLTTSTLLLLWYFLDINLLEVSFFKELGLENKKAISHLPFMLVGLQLYFLIESILEYKKIKKEKSGQLKFQFGFMIGFLLVSIITSYPKLIENTLFASTTRVDLIVPIISGIFIVFSLSWIKDSLEIIRTFYKFRGTVYFGMFIPLIIFIIIILLTIVFFLHYSSKLEFYNLGVLSISMIIIYTFFTKKENLFSKEKITELDKLNKSLNRQVEVSESIKVNNYEETLKKIKSDKKEHKEIMKLIKNEDETRAKNLNSRFKFNEEIQLQLNKNGAIKLEKPTDDNVVHFEMFDKSTGDIIEQLEIKFEYLELASKKINPPENKEDVNDFIYNLVWKAYELQKFSNVDNKNELLMELAYDGELEQLKELLKDDEIDVDYIAKNSWSPLLIATANGHYGTVKLLLEKAAEPNISNALGASSLHFAAKYGKKSLCKLLIKYNADINHRDMEGNTPLIKAVEKDDFEIVELLIENNANVSVKSNNNMTAFDYAKKRRNGKICRILKKTSK